MLNGLHMARLHVLYEVRGVRTFLGTISNIGN